MINVDVSVKNVMYMNKIMSATCNCENGNIQQVLWMIQQLFLMKL